MYSWRDRSVDYLIYFAMASICFIMVYPFIYVLAYSLSDSQQAMLKTITFWPRGITLAHYKTVLMNNTVYVSFFISIARTVTGVLYQLIIVGLAAYSLSKVRLPGNKWIALYLITPMFISGGLLPTYVLNYKLGLFNSFWIYVLPYGFFAFNMLIMRTFFSGIPEALEESARIDGAGEYTIFSNIYIPLSMPVVATISLFVGVFQWNQWFDSMLYIFNEKLWPLQYILQKLLSETLATQIMAQEGRLNSINNSPVSPESIKMSTLIIATLPIALVYPFLQRYFIKGVMIGAVKG
ncbi:carbohydrate ABC transporter permease [Paenibacillus sp. GCM10023252]|uniref:carbohydrate ABC transporter permease n=1 Tax=Paenibacillus sp. GCM10023252 TaxID=3252649 RepID=UPI003615BA83